MSERGGAQPDMDTNAEAPAAADPRRSPDDVPPITYPDGTTIVFRRSGREWLGFRGEICVIARPTLREAVEVEGARHGVQKRARRR